MGAGSRNGARSRGRDRRVLRFMGGAGARAALHGYPDILRVTGKPPAKPFNRHSRYPRLHLMEANGEYGRGTLQKAGRTTSAESGWTTTKVARKALGVSACTVQSYIRRGLLDGQSEGEGV